MEGSAPHRLEAAGPGGPADSRREGSGGSWLAEMRTSSLPRLRLRVRDGGVESAKGQRWSGAV